MREESCQTTALELILLILQFAFCEDYESVRVGLESLKCLFDFWQWGSGQVEQRFAVIKQVCQFCCRQMVTRYAEGGLDDEMVKALQP